MLKRLTKYLLIFLSASLLTIACKSNDGYFDKYAKLERDDMLDFAKSDNRAFALAKKKEQSGGDLPDAPVPKIASMLAFPEPPKFSQGNQIISFSVTEDIDLKDVLIELGRVTGLDVDIDPKISGGVIVNAKNRPLIEIIDRISNLGKIRYFFEDGILTFKSDTSFAKHHIVDYLIDGNLWDEVATNLGNILTNADEGATTSLNKPAGIITIFSNSQGQKAAEKYLAEVKRTASAQVLIEAKVVEVTLNDNYEAGIDWTYLDGGTNIKNQPTSSELSGPFTLAVAGSGILGGGATLSLKALEEFGNVRAISSPRISTLNNQQAKLDFIDKLVFFTVETDTSTNASTTTTVSSSVSATLQEEDVGVTLQITPSINMDTNEITMSVNPKLSVQNGTALDPSVDSTGKNLGNRVPIIQTREIQTSLKIKSGDTLVIGGLMKEDTSNTDNGIPFLSRIPIVGFFFKYSTKKTKVIETVIFIKATIVESATGIDKFDRDFHNKFTTDNKSFL